MVDDGRVALVTGAGGDLGRAIALLLARRGLTVALNGRNRAALEETRRQVAAAGGQALVLVADVGEPPEVAEMMAQVGQEYGRLDVLVNNAGINRDGPFDTMPVQDWDAVLRTNLTGPFLVTQAALPWLRQGEAPSVVNITARTALTGRANGANYCAAKAGLEMLTRCLAVELAPQIRVNAVAPGATDTTEVRERHGLDREANRERYLEAIPLARVSSPAEMAAMVAFVALDAPFMTGSTLLVDGGRNLR